MAPARSSTGSPRKGPTRGGKVERGGQRRLILASRKEGSCCGTRRREGERVPLSWLTTEWRPQEKKHAACVQGQGGRFNRKVARRMTTAWGDLHSAVDSSWPKKSMMEISEASVSHWTGRDGHGACKGFGDTLRPAIPPSVIHSCGLIQEGNDSIWITQSSSLPSPTPELPLLGCLVCEAGAESLCAARGQLPPGVPFHVC